MNCYARFLTLSMLLMFCIGASAQQLSLGKTPYYLNKSAVLDLNADNQGLLLPRIADTAAINLLAPPDGMIIYSVPMKQLLLRATGFWLPLPVASSLSSYWSTNGNSNGSIKTFGNTDNLDLPFITNNLERMRLTAGGFLGLGTTAPATLLHLSGVNPLTLMGVQLGSSAASDSVLTITNGLVRKLPVAAFQQAINGTGFVKASGTTISYDNNNYTIANTAITGATKTKITYDSKGLVTSGADATTTDIAEGTRLYFTDARVRSTTLTGFSAATATAVTATDQVLGGMGKLQGQINTINGAGYLTSNQNITLSGDISGSGTTAITTAIGTNKVTLPHLAQVATGSFLGRTTTGTGNVEALTTAQAKTLLGIGGTNSGDVALAGQNYLSLSGQTITANAVDLSGSHATGALAAARFGALTGDVTNTAGSYATTIAAGVVTYGKMQNISATNRLLGRASAGAGSAEEITIGSGLALSGTTLSATASGMWSTTGNGGTTWNTSFIGSTDNAGFRIRTNNTERFVIDSLGRIGAGITNPTNPFVAKDTVEIRRVGSVSSLLFTNTAGSGDFRIGGDGGDIFWQGGGGRNLQMGAHWGIVLAGDRQVAAFPSFLASSGGINVTIPAQRAASIPLAIQAAASQTANLTEWRNAGGTALNVVNAAGNFGIGTASPAEKLDVTGNLRFSGALMPGGAAGTLGNILVSSGSGAAPVWQDGTSYLSSNGWVQGGNSLSAIKNLGTTSNHALPFITNNTERMRITADGNVGIGILTPSEKLDIAGNIRLSGTTAKKIVFGALPGDLDASIGLRNTTTNEQQEMLFYVGNDNQPAYGPDRIRMVAEEFRLQTFNDAQKSSLANAESEAGTKTRLLINAKGNVAIGDSAFDATSPETLIVNAGSETYTPILAKGNYNGYFQINVKNNSTGNQSTSDLVATANNGTETTNFINLGINGSNYVYQNGNPIVTGSANDGYLISAGQNFYIANNNASKDIIFLAGGSESSNEAVRITANGRLGIGTTDPLANTKLDVGGAFKLGSRGTLVNNLLNFELTNANSISVPANGYYDLNISLPAANTLTNATRSTVTVSPTADLPAGVIIAYGRASSTSNIRIRFQNVSGTTASIPTTTKIDFTVVDY